MAGETISFEDAIKGPETQAPSTVLSFEEATGAPGVVSFEDAIGEPNATDPNSDVQGVEEFVIDERPLDTFEFSPEDNQALADHFNQDAALIKEIGLNPDARALVDMADQNGLLPDDLERNEFGNIVVDDRLIEAMQQITSSDRTLPRDVEYANTMDAVGASLQNVPERLSMGYFGLKLSAAELTLEQAASDADAIANYFANDAEMIKTNGMNPEAQAFVDWADQNGMLPEGVQRGRFGQVIVDDALINRMSEIAQEERAAISEGMTGIAQGNVDTANADIAAQRETLVDPNAEPGSIAYYVSSATGAMAEMAPALLASVLVRNPAPAMGFMFGHSKGHAYIEGRDEGLSPDQARLRSTLFGLAEGIPEALPVGLMLKGTGSLMRRLFEGAAAEGLQEMVTEALQMGIDKGFIEDDMTWQEARQRLIDSGIIGMLSGSGMAATIEAAQKGIEVAGDGISRIRAITRQIVESNENFGKNMDLMPDDATPELRAIDRRIRENGGAGLFIPEIPPQAQAPMSDAMAGVSQVERNVLAFIGDKEAPAGYDQVFSGSAVAPPKPITEMTIAEVRAWQDSSVRAGAVSSAAGRYQIIRKTMDSLVSQLGLTGNEIFDQDMQDRMAIQLMKGRGLDAFLAGDMSAEQFGNNLAKEWASMPVVSGANAGQSHYEGDGINSALTGVDTFMSILTGGDYTPGEMSGGSGFSGLPAGAAVQESDGATVVSSTPSAVTTENQDENASNIDGEQLPEVLTPDIKPIATGTRDAPAQPADIETAVEVVNVNPSEAQIEAGNYQKAHVKYEGLNITVENPKGSQRTGVDQDGKPWSVEMPAHYGYIKRTVGADGDHVDVYLGDGAPGGNVYVVDQMDPQTGTFDEHKAILGAPSEAEAMALYRSGFTDGKGHASNITEMSQEAFKTWLKDGNTKQPIKVARDPSKRKVLTGKDGKPVQLYHGTSAVFSKFKNPDKKTGEHEFRDDNDIGTFLTADPEAASYYASEGNKDTRNVHPVNVAMENPFEFDYGGKKKDAKLNRKMAEDAKAAGHDGIILRNVVDTPQLTNKTEDLYIPFDSSQISSVFETAETKKNPAQGEAKVQAGADTPLSRDTFLIKGEKVKPGQFAIDTSTPNFVTANTMSLRNGEWHSADPVSTDGVFMLLNSEIKGALLQTVGRAKRELNLPDGKLEGLWSRVPDTIGDTDQIDWKLATWEDGKPEMVVGLVGDTAYAIDGQKYGYLVNNRGFTISDVGGLFGIYDGINRVGAIMPKRVLGDIAIPEFLNGFETAEPGPVKSGPAAKSIPKPKTAANRPITTTQRQEVEVVRKEALDQIRWASKKIKSNMDKGFSENVEIEVTRPGGNKVRFTFVSDQNGMSLAKKLEAKWKTWPAAKLAYETPDIAALAFDQPMPGYVPLWRSMPTPARPADNTIFVAGDLVRLDPTNRPTRREGIRLSLEKMMGQKFYIGKIKGKSKAGFYRRKNGEVRIRTRDDIEVMAHEVAHWLDYHGANNGVFTKLRKTVDASARDQMKSLSYTSNPKSVESEGFAEFVRLWLTNFDAVSSVAPDFLVEFDALLETIPKLQNQMRVLRRDMHKYYFQGAIAQARSKVGEDKSAKAGMMRFLRDKPINLLRQQAIDHLQGIKVAERELTGGIASAEKSPFKLMQLVNGAEGVYDQIIRDGTIRLRDDGTGFENVGKPLSEIFSPVADNFDDFLMYAAGRRASELKDQGRENLFDKAQIQAMLDLETAEFVTAFQEYQQFNTEMLDFYVGMGLITPDAKKAFAENNQNYIPFHRIRESMETGESRGAGTLGARLTGGDANLRDLGSNITDGLMSNVKAAMQAHAKRSLYTMISNNENGAAFATKIGPDSKPVEVNNEQLARKLAAVLSDLGMAVSDNGLIVSRETTGAITDVNDIVEIIEKRPELLMFFQHNLPPTTQETVVDQAIINGKVEYFEINDPVLARSILDLQAFKTGNIIRAAMAVRRFQTRLITNMPQFFVPNITRDTVSAAIQSDSNFRPFLDSIRGMGKQISGDPIYVEWRKNGGGYSDLVQNITASGRIRSRIDLPASSALDYVAKLLAIDDKVAASFENATRIGEYDRAIAAGATPFEAAWQAREVSTDFSKRPGSQTWGMLLQITPFAKAALNGNDRTMRVFIGEDGRVNSKAVRRTAMKLTVSAGGAMAVFTAVLWLLNRDREEYKQLTPDQKTRFWHVFIGDRHIQIPKPYGVGFIFADTTEAALNRFVDGHGEEAGQYLAWAFAHHFMFMDWPGVMQPYMDHIKNEKFTGAPVIPEYMQDMPPEYQFTDRTPELYRLMGEKLGVSPLLAENYVRGYFGYFENFMVDTVDVMTWDEEAWGPRPFPRGVDDYLLKQFRGPEVDFRTKYTEGYYTLRQRAAGAAAAARLLMSQSVRDESLFTTFAGNDVNQTLIGLSKLFAQIDRSLGTLRPSLEAIKYDPTLTREQKEAQIAEIYDGKNELLADVYEQASAELERIEGMLQE